jgi:hypothetical protein
MLAEFETCCDSIVNQATGMENQNEPVDAQESNVFVNKEASAGSPSPAGTPGVDMKIPVRDGFFPYNEEKTMQSVRTSSNALTIDQLTH